MIRKNEKNSRNWTKMFEKKVINGESKVFESIHSFKVKQKN